MNLFYKESKFKNRKIAKLFFFFFFLGGGGGGGGEGLSKRIVLQKSQI